MDLYPYIIALVVFTIAVIAGAAALAGYVLPSGLLAALAIYIFWDAALARDTSQQEGVGFVPGQSAAQLGIFALVCAIFGTYLFFHPHHPPFTGRSAIVSSGLYAVFGVLGEPLGCWILALGFGAIWMAQRKSRANLEVHKGKGDA